MKRPICSLYIAIAIFTAILLITPSISYADVGVFNDVQTRFQNAASGTSAAIQSAANRLFWALAAISLVWTGISLVFRKGDISDFFAEFVRFILFIGFFNWLLTNGGDMATAILESFRNLGGSAVNTSDTLNPSGIVDIGFNLWNSTNNSVTDLGLEQIIPAYFLLILVVIVIGLIAINVLLLNISAWIFAYAGIFVLGFGGSRWTSDIAIAYFKQLLNLGLQILTMIILVGIGKAFIDDMVRDIDSFIFFDFIVIFLCVLILFYLTNKLPAMVGSIAGGFGNGGAGALGGGAVMAGMGMASGALIGAAASLKAAGMEMAGFAKAMNAAKSESSDNKKNSAVDAIKSSGSSKDNSSQQDGQKLTAESGGKSQQAGGASGGNSNSNSSGQGGGSGSSSNSDGGQELANSNNQPQEGGGSSSNQQGESENSISSGSSSSSNPLDNNGGDFRNPESMVSKVTNTGGGSPLASAMGGPKTNWQAAKFVASSIVRNKFSDAIDKTAGGRVAKQLEDQRKKEKGNENA